MFWFGPQNLDGHDCLVMVIEMLGPTLQDYFVHCNKEFNISTTAIVALKMVGLADQIEALEVLHSYHFLCKNISPETFCFGVGEKSHVMMLASLGNASLYKDPFSNSHIGYSEENIVTSFNAYTSVNVLAGIGSPRLQRVLETRRPRVGRLYALVFRQG